ncbi:MULTISPECIES: transketolase [Prauserella salsuginis group]|uniref:Transketolase n=1 Tax=Prauserella salsuginis TaxID=387889 RepID=A0ABW6G0W8_9PSEU|nr:MULTISPECIES: transketolase [Prauserella salsuginis group]MCR3722008.1 transketolase [Prauserella flava]MCR3736014.1 transketolase [Prauserella salsuginis]
MKTEDSTRATGERIPAETTVTGQKRLERIREAAFNIRSNALIQAEVQGQGYIGQALDIADVLAVLYADQLALRPDDPEWEGRDRCLLSIGHYALALYAALAEAKVLPAEELDTYASDDSRLPMSAMASYTPGVEISGGSLGHGLTIANGIAMGLKRRDNPAFVYNILSDGELNEGSTWEAAAVAGHHQLDNLIAIVDFNDQQADGKSSGVLGMEPVDQKFETFGWIARRVDGHDLPALLTALEELRAEEAGKPRCLVVDTKLGKGVEFLENREKLHFMRVAPDEWAKAHQQLKESYEA